MTGIVQARSFLVYSRAQFSRIVDALRTHCKDRILLFALSQDAPDLGHFVKELSSLTRESIGCLSNPLPIKTNGPFFSISIGIFERNCCVPFSALDTGEGPVQVGRWHSYERMRVSREFDPLDGSDFHDEMNWAELWSNANSKRFIPQELKNVQDARTLIYFSDNSSWGLASAIHAHLPQAWQLGIAAAPTPFITGHPFTLLRNGEVQPSGAVGIALRTSPSKQVLTLNGLEQLTQSLVIKRSEGNLIHELEGSLPARILFKAIQERGIPDDLAKEVDYYIGIRDSDTEKRSTRFAKIIAGSPSRGSIAIEETVAPPASSVIEFYYRPKSSPIRLEADMFQQTSGVLFGSTIDNLENTARPFSNPTHGSNDYRSFDKSFVVSSEHVFVLGTHISARNGAPWKCTVPGTLGGLVFI